MNISGSFNESSGKILTSVASALDERSALWFGRLLGGIGGMLAGGMMDPAVALIGGAVGFYLGGKKAQDCWYRYADRAEPSRTP